MMKKMNKKGFTLIELLAIIVILAIIAVITVPIILNVIDNAKKGAAKNSVIGYGKAVELAYTEKQFADAMGDTYAGDVDVTLGTGDTATTIKLDVNYEGDDVSCTTKTIDGGKVSLAGCTVTSYGDSVSFKYVDGEATEEPKANS